MRSCRYGAPSADHENPEQRLDRLPRRRTPPGPVSQPPATRGRTACDNVETRGMTELYTLAEAARICDVTLATIRKRADRGSLQITKRDDGARLVTHAELDRTGLLAGSELHRLRRENAGLRDELAAHRRLTERAHAEAAAERDGHARVTAALVEQRAIATTAEARATELEQLERALAAAGPIRAWRLARAARNTR